ncbi:hypothetical protein Val02_28390 [Virgisporangium aliadipatigenens]|uniref:Uncharacterized protein n=1 Tax=Virgisporangium aliadipatigenens TaxID=741659 RepID=A0A8J3YLG7_9ACTN|nr:DUF6334 family protein [Virgisporangium aliadipatigenens]GIJ45953.1 hypothetical protein Val02_28390 [Virgisporangium aliadipatigenens]
MTLYDDITDLTVDAGPLQYVGYHVDPAFPRDVAGIRLRFAHGAWLVGVDSDDDTVTLQKVEGTAPAGATVVDAGGLLPWAAALGKHVQWRWVLENQQGYTDALQIEFTDRVRVGSVTIQVLAIGSALRVHAVLPVETPLLVRPPAG